jgi:tetratricopeptide (TPR) repeat protein
VNKFAAFFVLAGAFSRPLAAAEDPVLAAREAFLSAKMAEADGRLQQALEHYQEALQLRPEDPVLHFELALLYHQLDVDEQAARQARRATELDAQFAPAWRLLGTIDLAASEKDSARLSPALEELSTAHKLSPQTLQTTMALCRAYLSDGAPDKARAVLDDVPGLSENPAFFRIVAEADDKRGADAAAREDYERWLAEEPDDREATAAAIEFFESRQDFERAIELLKALGKADPENSAIGDRIALDLLRSGQFAEGEKTARKLIEARPEDRAARRTLALIRYQLGESEESSAILQKLIDEDPDDATAAFTLAFQKAADGKPAVAIATLESLAARIGNDPARADLKQQINGEIAALFFRDKRNDRAREIAEASVFGRDSVDDRSLNVLLQLARDEKKPDQALSLAQRAATREPKNAEILAAVAEFQIRAGKKESGDAGLAKLAASGIAADVLAGADARARLKDYSASADIAGKGVERFEGNAELLFRWGSALERAGKTDTAEAAFSKLLEIRPGDAQALNYLGYMYADRGIKLTEARQMIEKAVTLDPRNGAYLDSLGWVYFRLSDLPNARKYLSEAVARIPDDATIQEHLGDLEAKSGQKAEALLHWKKSLTLTPDEPEKIERKIRDSGGEP